MSLAAADSSWVLPERTTTRGGGDEGEEAKQRHHGPRGRDRVAPVAGVRAQAGLVCHPPAGPWHARSTADPGRTGSCVPQWRSCEWVAPRTTGRLAHLLPRHGRAAAAAGSTVLHLAALHDGGPHAAAAAVALAVLLVSLAASLSCFLPTGNYSSIMMVSSWRPPKPLDTLTVSDPRIHLPSMLIGFNQWQGVVVDCPEGGQVWSSLLHLHFTIICSPYSQHLWIHDQHVPQP